MITFIVRITAIALPDGKEVLYCLVVTMKHNNEHNSVMDWIIQ